MFRSTRTEPCYMSKLHLEHTAYVTFFRFFLSSPNWILPIGVSDYRYVCIALLLKVLTATLQNRWTRPSATGFRSTKFQEYINHNVLERSFMQQFHWSLARPYFNIPLTERTLKFRVAFWRALSGFDDMSNRIVLILTVMPISDAYENIVSDDG